MEENVCEDCVYNGEKFVNGKFVPWCYMASCNKQVKENKCLGQKTKWLELEEAHFGWDGLGRG